MKHSVFSLCFVSFYSNTRSPIYSSDFVSMRSQLFLIWWYDENKRRKFRVNDTFSQCNESDLKQHRKALYVTYILKKKVHLLYFPTSVFSSQKYLCSYLFKHPIHPVNGKHLHQQKKTDTLSLTKDISSPTNDYIFTLKDVKIMWLIFSSNSN